MDNFCSFEILMDYVCLWVLKGIKRNFGLNYKIERIIFEYKMKDKYLNNS